MKPNGKWVIVSVVFALLPALVGALLLFRSAGGVKPGAALENAPVTLEKAALDAWKQAVLRLEEERGEPVGRQAVLNIPPQLKHYSNPKRFLAIQVAEARKRNLKVPADFVELAELINEGELEELTPLGDGYILYGVGFTADDGPFTHLDRKTGRSITLFAGETELRQEYDRLEQSLSEFENETVRLREELKKAGPDRQPERASLRAAIAAIEKSAKELRERKKLLEALYDSPKSRRRLFTEYENLSTLAADFSGRKYDLADAASRKELKVRLLSFLRPPAINVLTEVARSYNGKFDRLLPVTSVVRTEEYQRRLSKVNSNATLIETPPHSTGLAFDIFYRYMTAEEQTHVMSDLARLRDEGRVEALRENRDHFHVFAFAEGRRPDEKSIQASLRKTAVPERERESRQTAADAGRGRRRDGADAPAQNRVKGDAKATGRKRR